MSKNHLRVAAAQISSGTSVPDNLEAALAAVRRAAEAGARLAVLPEATMFWFGGDVRSAAEPLDGPFASAIRGEARRSGINVAVGMFEPAADGRVYNTLLVTGPDGETHYRKVHLYDALGARESDTVAPGSSYVTAVVDGVTVGLATCYDLRFPDQFMALGRGGAEVIAVSASWGDGPTKADQWDVLVRARAMDAQSWLLACGQAWRAPQGAAPLGIGRSAVVDPLGMVRSQLSAAPGTIVYDLDLALVREMRARLPTLSAAPAVA